MTSALLLIDPHAWEVSLEMLTVDCHRELDTIQFFKLELGQSYMAHASLGTTCQTLCP
jgi:hypothetical protein